MDRFGPVAISNRSAEEFDRTIRQLNSDFGLRLQPPSRQNQHLPAQRLNDDLYERLRILHYQDKTHLSAGLGRFQVEARQLLSPFGYTTRDRAALQQCLLDILFNVPVSGQSRWKRRSDEFPVTPAIPHKKARTPPNSSYSRALDALTVRSRAPTAANYPEYCGSLSISMEEDVSSFSHDVSFASHSFASSEASRPSAVFSSGYGGASVSSSRTTIPLEYSYSQSSNSLYEKKNVPVREAAPKDSPRFFETEYSAVSPEHSFGWLGVAENDDPGNTSSSSGELMEPAIASINDTVDEPLDERLANIWPKPLGKGFNEAPLAVLWEVTRAALHCHVNPADIDLKCEPSDRWLDQSKLRSDISAHRLFAGKQLPVSSDAVAWDLSLKEFQTKVRSVQLCAELTYNESADGPLYKLRLLPLKTDLSHRLARRFGADRFLEVIVPSPDTRDRPAGAKGYGSQHLVAWLTKTTHNVLGRTWVPFYLTSQKKKAQAKGKSSNTFQERLYFFACNGHIFRPPSHLGSFPPQEETLSPSNRTSMKLSGLLEWAVNIRHEKNSRQPVTKLFSRLSLSLSQNWPTVVLERSQIILRDRDLGSDSVMNDGIGRLSRPLAVKIGACLGLTDCPSAFQARLGSAKGMWIIDVKNENPDEDWIEIFPSQEKWKCDFTDPHHRTFEVRNWPRELKSASLNQQFIPVLEAQSINPNAMRDAISGHLVSALRGDLDSQISAMQEPLDLRLWVQQSGLANSDRSMHEYAQFVGGLPDNNSDKVAFLLDSGFDQRKMRYLKDLVWDMCKRKAEVLESKMNVSIPCSAYVYMAADFSGTLEEDEVHISFSTKFQVEGFSDTLLEHMDLLVARAPAHFPSDIQKVRVVSRPELRKLKDVIIFSTRGQTPLADRLSGGDYDGDLAWVCWDPKIVDNFQNALVPKTMDLFEAGYLGKHKLKFMDLRDRAVQDGHGVGHDSAIDRACGDFIFEAMSFNLRPSFLGQCTRYKEKICYSENSVTSPAAIFLSALLSNLVDQRKQGILFSDEDWTRFREKCINKPKFPEEPDYATGKQSRPSKHNKRLHILDYLRFDVAKVVIDKTLTEFDKAIGSTQIQNYDQDLTKLYSMHERSADADSTGCTAVLRRLKADLEEVANKWKLSLAGDFHDGEDQGFTLKTKQIHQQWLEIKPPKELMSTPFAKAMMNDWGSEPNTSEWQLLKASTTFAQYHRSMYKFVWHVAGRQLGFIKSRTQSHGAERVPVLVVPEMWRALKADKKVIMSLKAQRERAKDLVESAAALEEVYDFDDNGTVIDDT